MALPYAEYIELFKFNAQLLASREANARFHWIVDRLDIEFDDMDPGRRTLVLGPIPSISASDWESIIAGTQPDDDPDNQYVLSDYSRQQFMASVSTRHELAAIVALNRLARRGHLEESDQHLQIAEGSIPPTETVSAECQPTQLRVQQAESRLAGVRRRKCVYKADITNQSRLWVPSPSEPSSQQIRQGRLAYLDEKEARNKRILDAKAVALKRFREETNLRTTLAKEQVSLEENLTALRSKHIHIREKKQRLSYLSKIQIAHKEFERKRKERRMRLLTKHTRSIQVRIMRRRDALIQRQAMERLELKRARAIETRAACIQHVKKREEVNKDGNPEPAIEQAADSPPPCRSESLASNDKNTGFHSSRSLKELQIEFKASQVLAQDMESRKGGYAKLDVIREKNWTRLEILRNQEIVKDAHQRAVGMEKLIPYIGL